MRWIQQGAHFGFKKAKEGATNIFASLRWVGYMFGEIFAQGGAVHSLPPLRKIEQAYLLRKQASRVAGKPDRGGEARRK